MLAGCGCGCGVWVCGVCGVWGCLLRRTRRRANRSLAHEKEGNAEQFPPAVARFAGAAPARSTKATKQKESIDTALACLLVVVWEDLLVVVHCLTLSLSLLSFLQLPLMLRLVAGRAAAVLRQLAVGASGGGAAAERALLQVFQGRFLFVSVNTRVLRSKHNATLGEAWCGRLW